ncbi:MAG: NirD/YgiW/YdeI family stress tolerance protein [Treponema sp.]|jgi:uncharacterized protein (TIGR00156 family)|nr:NirD/YgiW/YdeI family stress tolerance protein [Treponema sp.]
MKRKIFGCLLLALALIGSMVYAQEGYRGPSANPVTVERAKGMRDDAAVTLRGKLEQFLGDEKYLFADDTGSIIVEIENKLWRGLSVDQNDTVEITGEIDRDFKKIEVEVRSIKKI